MTKQDATRNIDSYKYFDGLGRPVRSFLYDGTPSTPWSVADTYYDNLGRVSKVSNTYRVSSLSATVPASCSACTTTGYDALGRVISVKTPDGAQVTTVYGGSMASPLGTTVTVTDQALKLRRSLTDALGRLVRVDEPDGNGSLGSVSSPNQPTSYSYDVLGNLRMVTQGSQQRFFTYDSLSRLLRARNAELAVNTSLPLLTDPVTGNSQWSMAYSYDANGNLTQKTDARNISIDYGYDALNRNTTVNYSDTTTISPDVKRIYDGAPNGKGRLWQSYAGGNETLGSNVEHNKIQDYDELGRPRFQSQRIKLNGGWGQYTYETHRIYNLAGAVTSQTYPSGRTVSYAYDDAGRTNSFTGNLGDAVARTYSSGIIYSPLGGIAKEQFGTDTPVFNKLFYNSRGQLAEIRETTSDSGPSDTTWNRGKFINWYSLQCGGEACDTTDNNGNLRKQETLIPINEQNTSSVSWYQQYDYDWLNRLHLVHEYTGNTPTEWQQEYVYDRWGNRTIHQGITNTWGTGINKKDFTVNTGNNQLGVPIGQLGVMTYDNAGNLIIDTYTGAGTRTYDAENRMTTAFGGNNQLQVYTYNADGQRTRRKVDGLETWQVYGMDGELLAEYAANAPYTTPQKEYGYRNGQLLVTAVKPVNVGLATGGSMATASSIHSSGNFPVASTINGDRTGATWGSSTGGWNDDTRNAYPDTLEVTFSSIKTIDEIDVVTLQNNWTTAGQPTLASAATGEGILDFIVQYCSANCSTWTTIPGGNVSGNDKAWRQFTFPAVTTTKIRVVINNARNNWSRIVELEAYQGGSSAVHWLVTDQLGTPRMTIDQTGALANVKRHDYLPFGEELYALTGGRTTTQGYVADSVRQKFTLKERDNETGLDYFEARYYSSMQGRFTSVDPENYQAMRDLSDPQSWNAYAYVNNNPLGRVDPDGRGLWERLRNLFNYGCACTDTRIAQMEQERREWLSQHYYERDAQGNWRPFDSSNLNRRDLWDKYREVRALYDDKKLTQLSDKEILDARNKAPIIAIGPTGSEPWRSTTASRPLDKMGHAAKHLKEFQKVDPNLTNQDVAKILDYVRNTATPTSTSFGGKAFEAAVNIGGKSVTVKVIESAGGVIKTGYPVP